MLRRFLIVTAFGLGLCAIWSGLVIAAALEGWLKDPVAARGDPHAFIEIARQRVKGTGLGSCALALIENGRVFDSVVYSAGDPVGDATLYQMASVSKWVTSWGVMTLVQQGRLGLDLPVQRYLTRWQLPPSEFDNAGVTVRRLLSHTAGLTDGLGYAGFPPGTPAQSLEGSLTYATDHTQAADGHTRVGNAPGSRWMYSGGGFALLQLVIEEITHQRFAQFMQQAVLDPLGMSQSTYDEDAAVARGIATSYWGHQPVPHYRFASPAAASLYSNLADMARFVVAHLPGDDGAPPGRGVLAPETVAAMRAPAAQWQGRTFWGLGTILFAKSGPSDHVFGHDGDNLPAIEHAIRIDPATRSGIIILSSGDREFAQRLAADWVYWKTGGIDFFVFLGRVPDLLRTIAIGAAVIVVITTLSGIVWARSRRRRTGSI